jgi:50S ribosomal protein L16 3-hydroxylase
MVLEKLADRDAFARWFGGYNSTPKYPDIDWAPEEAMSVGELRARLAAGEALQCNPASRFSFVRQGSEGVLLFVDGECFECEGDVGVFAEVLCAGDSFTVAPSLTESEAAMNLLAQLFNQGCLATDSE